jgi:hypothetical protein
MTKVSQGRRLIDLLKRRPYTTMDMLATGISTCPWRRLSECLRDYEQLIIAKNERGLNVYRVVSVRMA